MRWSADMRQLALRIPASTLRMHLAMLTNRAINDDLVFESEMVPSSSWAAALRTMAHGVNAYAGRDLPTTISSRLFDMFLTAFILTQHSNWTARLFMEDSRSAHDAVDLAIDQIEAHPEDEWSLAILASNTGVSARTLQNNFQNKVGQTPMEYILNARLRRAHTLLTDTRYEELSISDIAVKAGFVHLGRFASSYRLKFGALPSQVRRTLRAIR